MLKKNKLLWRNIRALVPSIFFNFYYLPVKQAIKLPIMIYKPHFHKMGGKVIIEGPVRHNMIRLGFFGGHMYPNNGIHWTQEGGTIIFRGRCRIGNNSFIVQGKDSTVVFGNDFMASTSLKLISFKSIVFGDHNRVGWECIFMDTNFHPIYDMNNHKFKKAYGPIEIGNNNWFGAQCKVMHSVFTPQYCIFAMGAIITRGLDFESYALYGGSPLHVLSRNVKRIIGQDMITDYSQ